MRIEDYGFIGDTQTGALVGKNGSIDWLCVPRFDSGACFAALLGDEKNGCWKLAPTAPHRASQRYRKDTLVLETEFETESGYIRLTDCMPPRGEYPDVVRVVEGVHGEVEIAMKLVLRFDNGLAVPWVFRNGDDLIAIAGPNGMLLRCDVATHGENLSTIATFTLRAGEKKSFVLTWFPSHLQPPEPAHPHRSIIATEKYWRDWTAKCTYEGEWRGQVVRSLITLKALTYGPTGGVIAAATTSLPEKVGGIRNWDYRYVWLRDATFMLYALTLAGYTDEACAWRDWLLRAIAGNVSQMQIMYGPAGERQLPEFELNHLAGYENSRPVRVGNAASEQFQLDVYGEIMDAMYQARRSGLPPNDAFDALQRQLIEAVAARWQEPDEGIWEIRGPRRHFTYSKVMAWVAVDRAVKSGETFGLQGDVAGWRQLRDQIHEAVCAQGYDATRGTFTQFFGSDQLDASLLMIPLVGFLPADDPRVRGTIEAIERTLVVDGFVLRYHPANSASVDGLPPGEGAFLPCSFWLADCLEMLGRHDEARAWFTRLLEICSPLGLLSEEYDPVEKRQVGNFPQAFSHVGLINTALNLSASHGPAEHRCTT
ncbi:MAG: glycoside hydrolase family 15 protein [Chthoniobacterales bacterium]